jgi:hypothetical protein
VNYWAYCRKEKKHLQPLISATRNLRYVFTGKREWKRSVGNVFFILPQFLGLDALHVEKTLHRAHFWTTPFSQKTDSFQFHHSPFDIHTKHRAIVIVNFGIFQRQQSFASPLCYSTYMATDKASTTQNVVFYSEEICASIKN